MPLRMMALAIFKPAVLRWRLAPAAMSIVPTPSEVDVPLGPIESPPTPPLFWPMATKPPVMRVPPE